MGGGNGEMKDRVSVCISLLLVASSLLFQARQSQAELNDEDLQLTAGYLFLYWLRQEETTRLYKEYVCQEQGEDPAKKAVCTAFTDLLKNYGEKPKEFTGKWVQVVQDLEKKKAQYEAAKSMAYQWLEVQKTVDDYSDFVCNEGKIKELAERYEIMEDVKKAAAVCTWLSGMNDGERKEEVQKIAEKILSGSSQQKSAQAIPAPSKAVLFLGGLLTLALPLLHFGGNKHPLPKSPDPTA